MKHGRAAIYNRVASARQTVWCKGPATAQLCHVATASDYGWGMVAMVQGIAPPSASAHSSNQLPAALYKIPRLSNRSTFNKGNDTRCCTPHACCRPCAAAALKAHMQVALVLVCSTKSPERPSPEAAQAVAAAATFMMDGQRDCLWPDPTALQFCRMMRYSSTAAQPVLC